MSVCVSSFLGELSSVGCFVHKRTRIVGGAPVGISDGSWMVSIQKGYGSLFPCCSFTHFLNFSFFSTFYPHLSSSLHLLMLYYHKGQTVNYMGEKDKSAKTCQQPPKTHRYEEGIEERTMNLFHQGCLGINLFYCPFYIACLSVCQSIHLPSSTVALLLVDKLSITHAGSLSSLCTHILI